MDNFSITDVAVTRLGAACVAARSLRTNVAAAGANHVLGQRGLLAVTPGARRNAALRPVQAMSAQQMSQLPWFAAEQLPMTVTVTTKPKHAHKTRINAGGYGAMGPHHQRERLA